MLTRSRHCPAGVVRLLLEKGASIGALVPWVVVRLLLEKCTSVDALDHFKNIVSNYYGHEEFEIPPKIHINGSYKTRNLELLLSLVVVWLRLAEPIQFAHIYCSRAPPPHIEVGLGTRTHIYQV